ncbi:hypothetical protein [Paenibacillus odorifer]|uniref:Uncharacterized protein n=1 Tax=Paenibacillus odorifer TaxID=189426 RepID=A0A1R0XKM1_9BACL|nr:hypothetical protein [Paenibacillus odorifer]OMD35645.1 hypothetical protein BSK52_26460 [Paenibacillus odorifer]
MTFIVALSIMFFLAWTHAVYVRFNRHDAAYNKVIFLTGFGAYLTLNFLQAQMFPYKTAFNLFFILFSCVFIPLHIWIMLDSRKSKTEQ